MSLSKLEIRELLRPLRRLILPAFRQAAGLAAAGQLIQSPYFQPHQTFACYAALGQEFDTQPIIQALWQAGKSCYLPVIDTERQILRFARYQPQDPLQTNRYGILEPVTSEDIREAQDLDVVLVPLIAFDEHGNRVGTGGGYYDRSFNFLLGQRRPQKPHLLGLGYELQKVPRIPPEPFDVPLEGAITEQALYTFRDHIV